jgi:hypothetical protein
MTGRGGIGLGGVLIVVVLSLLFRQDFTGMLGLVSGDVGSSMDVSVESTAEEELLVDFASWVLDDAQTTWAALLPQLGMSYRDARMVLFRDEVRSACGFAQAVAGHSTVPVMRGFPSTSASSRSYNGGSLRRATSPRHTCSPTKWVITFRESWVPPMRSGTYNNNVPI